MTITYDQIRLELKELTKEVAASREVVPSIFSNLKVSSLPIGIYFSFYFLCLFTDVYIKTIWQGLGLMSSLFWLFIALFVSSYKQNLSMLPKDAEERFEIVRIYKSKMKSYYIFWNAIIFLAGLVSVVTNLNVLALFVLTFSCSFFLVIFFNIDVSRYQLASAFGVLSAVEEKINGRRN